MKYGKLEIEDFRKEVKKKNVFIGNIMKKNGGIPCINFDNNNIINNDTLLRSSILIRICNNPKVYVELDSLKDYGSYMDIYACIGIDTIKTNDIVLSGNRRTTNNLYVDEKSLKPYFNTKRNKVSINELKGKTLVKTKK